MTKDKASAQGLRQSMAWLHTWVGLLPGWVLYVVFVFGTVAFFQHEIDGWMRPELPPSTAVSARALAAADGVLSTRGAGADGWSVSLPEPRGGSGLGLSWRMAGADRHDRKTFTLDPATGEEIVLRDTRGGFFLYRFHFDLHYMPIRWARYLVCVMALAMLVAILSGVVTHKKIFTDFFLLRFGKGQRSWLDAHNVTAVLALPFHLMITYTGLVTLLFTLMPWAISANFPTRESFDKSLYVSAPKPETGEGAASVIPVARMIEVARRNWGGIDPSFIDIDHPGKQGAVASLYPGRTGFGGKRIDTLYLDATSGAILPVDHPARGGATATRHTMVDLHTGWFAGYGLRWLYFLSGVGGVVMVATGLCLWCVKRRARLPDPARPHLGFRVVERLNIGFLVGAPAGIAVYFLANRLLPLGMEHRADWEINSMFIGWGAIFVWTLARPARRAWIEGLMMGALLYALVPVVNAITTQRGLATSLIARDWVFIAFDLTMLSMAGTFALAARKLAMRQARPAPRRRARGEAAA